MASEGDGTVRKDTAMFSKGNLFAFIAWSRLPGGYHWQDSDRLPSLSRAAQRAFKATGFTVVRGDPVTVNGYLAQYRIISLAGGSSDRCGVFDLKRANHLILGTVCAETGDVPLMAVLQGLSIDNVIEP